jgi:hypothetical protein
MLAAMAVIMAAAAAIGAVHMVVMIVVTVLMAAVLVMHMSLVDRLLPVRVGVVLGSCCWGAVVDAGDLREVAKAFSCGHRPHAP